MPPIPPYVSVGVHVTTPFSYEKDLFVVILPIVLPLLLLVSYGLSTSDLVREITEQRTTGLQVSTKHVLLNPGFFTNGCSRRAESMCQTVFSVWQVQTFSLSDNFFSLPDGFFLLRPYRFDARIFSQISP